MLPNFLKRNSPNRISKLVEMQMKIQFSGLQENKLRGLISLYRLPIPISSLIAVIVFLVFWISNEFCNRHGIILATYKLDADTASEILVSYLGYLAILIGIIIPVFLLIIPYVEGFGFSSVMDIYLNRVGVKKATTLTVLALALESLAVWFVRISIVFDSKTLFYLTFFLTLLNLSVLLETAMIIGRVINILNTRVLIEALVAKITQEAKKSQQNEAKYRLKRIASVELYRLLKIKKVPSFFQSANQISISSPSSGLIEDIDIETLSQLTKKLQDTALVNGEEKILITKLVGDYIDKNQALAFISNNEIVEASEIQKLLLRAFSIRKPPQEAEELHNLLKQLKNRTEFTIRGHDEELFEKMISVYSYLYDLYIQLPLPPSVDPFPELFRGWRAISIANLQLNEIARTAISVGDDRIISRLANEVNRIAAAMILNTHEDLNESFPDVLRLFLTIYSASYRSGNKTGIGQSYYYLTGSLIDLRWVRQLQKNRDNLRIIKNLHRALKEILRTNTELLRDMINNQDATNLHQLLQKMQPNELLSYLRGVIPDSGERFRLQNALQTSTMDQRNQLEQQIEALEVIESIRREVGEFYTQLIFVLASYLVEGYEKNLFSVEFTKQFLEAINKNPYFQTFPNNVNLLPQVTGPGVTFTKWNLFNRHPDTKQAYSSDDERKYLLFYCFSGITKLYKQPDINSLPILDLQVLLPRINQICDQIITSSLSWELILDIDKQNLERLVREFQKINQRIFDEWNTRRETQIIEAELDPEKTALFTNKLINTINTLEGIRKLLKLYNRFNVVSNVPGRMLWGFNLLIPDKEDFTNLSPSTNFVEEWGVYLGAHLVRVERNNILKLCATDARKLRTRKGWKTLEPYLTAGLKALPNPGYLVDIILVPRNMKYELFESLPGFENAYSRSNNIEGIFGYYQNIPILNWLDEKEPFLLFWDIAHAFELQVENPIIEVKNLSDPERPINIEKDSQVAERDLLLSVRVKIVEKVKITWLDRSALIKLHLHLPPESYYMLDLHQQNSI